VAEPVKGKSEAGRRREERARHTRERVAAAAYRLFLDRGYAATTVEAIAREAGVAPATVYQAFGTKQAILERALDITIAGDAAPVALLERDWVDAARQETDGSRRLTIVVAHAAEVAARTAAIKDVMRDAAATDAAAGELIRQDTVRRYITQQAIVDLVVEVRPLRPGIDRDTAVATFFALVNSATYRLLVGQLGWTTKKWTRWLHTMLERELFGVADVAPPLHRTGMRRSRPRP
jgi:AcrR family transcriptional regulator